MKISACGVGDVPQTFVGVPLLVTVICNGGTRSFTARFRPEKRENVQESTYRDIEEFVHKLIEEKPLALSYIDDEYDKVYFSSTSEWQEAVKLAVIENHKLDITADTEFKPKAKDMQRVKLNGDEEICIIQKWEMEEDKSVRKPKAVDEKPPLWFGTYMEKFREELLEDVCYSVNKMLKEKEKAAQEQAAKKEKRECKNCHRKFGKTCHDCNMDLKKQDRDLVESTTSVELSRERIETHRNTKLQRLIETKAKSERERNELDLELALLSERVPHPYWTKSRSLSSANMNAQYLYDETVPDTTKFRPGTYFMKTWRVVNTGTEQWNEDTKLKFLWGSKAFEPKETLVAVPPLKPKQVGSISVKYTAPIPCGLYESHWSFTHEGQLFGHRVWCVIVVSDSNEDFDDEDNEYHPNYSVLLPEKKENYNPKDYVCDSYSDDADDSNSSDDDADSKNVKKLSERKSVTESDLASVLSVESNESKSDFVVVPMPPCFILPPDDMEKDMQATHDLRPAVVTGNAYSSSSSVVFIASDGEGSTNGSASSQLPAPPAADTLSILLDPAREEATPDCSEQLKCSAETGEALPLKRELNNSNYDLTAKSVAHVTTIKLQRYPSGTVEMPGENSVVIDTSGPGIRYINPTDVCLDDKTFLFVVDSLYALKDGKPIDPDNLEHSGLKYQYYPYRCRNGDCAIDVIANGLTLEPPKCSSVLKSDIATTTTTTTDPSKPEEYSCQSYSPYLSNEDYLLQNKHEGREPLDPHPYVMGVLYELKRFGIHMTEKEILDNLRRRDFSVVDVICELVIEPFGQEWYKIRH